MVKPTFKFTIGFLLSFYLATAIWMNVFAFITHNCETTVFSVTWPVWAFGHQIGLEDTDWYENIESHIVDTCID